MKSIAIFGGSKLGQGPWRPGKKVWSVVLLSGSELDFRQAELQENVTQVVAVSLIGGTKIIVPKDLPVTLGGFSILGAKGIKRSQAKELPPASAKGLQINAISIFGGCAVSEE